MWENDYVDRNNGTRGDLGMLETLHLTKIYKTKGGADVKALDDVTIQFPTKGMVFLLGKSGSGKSTLLNVCGGLDAPTGGAVVVKGRSSASFTQSDFDSYRNTFVGFIFQEYNILNEFTVEDNIALALELQGKPKDKKVIADLLEQVDLAGYAKRKPNTLSGGQKQRIAIARALVKSPEIIMADEPTGALDSETGKQVFDTLKKLSKDKLVIVVSHDRDFAETYADRIIELQDGKVISDVTKTKNEGTEYTENISIVGETLCIKNGAELTEADFEEIKNFVSRSQKDVIIATGEEEVQAFKEANHIHESGAQEIFVDSEEFPVEKVEYTPQDSRFIRSKLPVRHAIKIGLSGLKTKPIRLAFTVLLCTMAFVFFGLLSTMTFYDSEATFKESLKDSDYEMVKLGKVYNLTNKWYSNGKLEDEYSYPNETAFTPKELEDYITQYGKTAFGAVQTWGEGLNIQTVPSRYWRPSLSSLAYLPQDNPLREKITGAYPQNVDEICISSYMAEVLYTCKILDRETGNVIELSSPEDAIGKSIYFNNNAYKIVGIMDSGEIPEKYDVLKDPEAYNSMLSHSLGITLEDGLHMLGFVSLERLEQVADEFGSDRGINDFENRNVLSVGKLGETKTNLPEYPNGGYSAYSKYGTVEDIIPLIGEAHTPGSGEVVLSKWTFCGILQEIYMKEAGDSEEKQALLELAQKLFDGGEYKQTGDNAGEFVPYSKEEMTTYFNQLIEAFKKDGRELTISLRLFSDMDGVAVGEEKEYTVVGLLEDGIANMSYAFLLGDEEFETLWEEQKSTAGGYYEQETNYVVPADAIYSTIYLPYDHSNEQTDTLLGIYNQKDYGEDDSRITLTSNLITNLEMVDTMVDALSKVFLVVGIILAVFAALLLSNFISVSISYKKKEIGILRAVGARSLDVFKIFFSESFFITIFCLILAIIGTVAGCAIVNDILVDLISASLFVFGAVSFGVLLLVAVATTVVATFLPVWNAARKKPVESIRAL